VPDKAIEVLVDEESAALKPGTPHFWLPPLKSVFSIYDWLDSEVQVSGFYNPALLLNYWPELFNLDKDHLV
jgi:hypothetical protein